MTWATCHVEDCENAGIPIDVGDLTYVDDEIGETHTMTVFCGVCSQVITDTSETQPVIPEPEPEEEFEDV